MADICNYYRWLGDILEFSMPLLPWGRGREALKRAEELLKECCQRLDLGEKVFGKSSREWISRRKWDDGDPSEMRRLIYCAVLASRGKEIEAAHFPPRRRRDHEAYTKAQFEDMALEEIVRHKVSHFFEKLGKVEVRNVHRTVITQVEKPLVELCLKWAKGNQLKAAQVLGINRNTLRKKIRTLGIEVDK